MELLELQGDDYKRVRLRIVASIGASIEDTRKRSHERREQAGHDKTMQARRKQILQQHRERPLRSLGLETVGQFGDIAALRQSKTNQPGNDEEVDGKKLQKSSNDTYLTGHILARCSQGALDDVLVGTPVPDADHRGADHPTTEITSGKEVILSGIFTLIDETQIATPARRAK